MDIIETIKEQIENNAILLYMKGSPNAPQCGFSQRATQALMACGEKFAYVDILANPDIRANLPAYANWPTFPQLWVDGELVGGCDIITEMHESGELEKSLKLQRQKYKLKQYSAVLDCAPAEAKSPYSEIWIGAFLLPVNCALAVKRCYASLQYCSWH